MLRLRYIVGYGGLDLLLATFWYSQRGTNKTSVDRMMLNLILIQNNGGELYRSWLLKKAAWQGWNMLYKNNNFIDLYS